jgi:hypothetical protein
VLPPSRIADLRHRDALVCADSRVTKAVMSMCVTAASGTRSHGDRMHIVRIAGYDRERSPLVTRTGASRSSSETALPIRPLISLRLDPRLNSRPPVSNMTSNPVTGRALTTVTPTVERGYRHAEQLRNLEQRHEPFAALERSGQAFWRSSHTHRRRSLIVGREWHEHLPIVVLH